MRNGCRLAAAALACALAGAIAPSASALVVHGHNGHFLGIQLHRGINPAAIPGSIAAGQTTATRPRPDNGILTYHGGPVVHSSAPYLIFWVPSGESIPGSSRALMERYFTDAAADSGKTDDVFGVSRQYTDATGFADYRQTFGSATHALIDTQPYPPTDTTNCPGSTYPTCITDAQLQQELQRLVAADGLPNDGPASAAELPQSAPIYFIVLPGDVNVCGSGLGCASTTFCAYHSSLTDNSSNTLLYAAMPMLLAINNPKACQSDGNTAVQQPNGDPADLVIDDLSHEDNETITDPLGTSWYDPTSGNEEADGCSSFGSFSPSHETDPNAYLPTLGGDANAGTLYDQLINDDQYYTQSEWSNGDRTSTGSGCQMQPAAGTIAPSFTVSGATEPGSSLSFDPSASTSTFAISSETWDFGDGTTPVFDAGGLTSVSHTYTTPATYMVTLTLVDNRGNIQTTSQQVTIAGPTASFSHSPSSPLEGSPVSFNGGSSTPASGEQITSYAWNFGDGTTGTGTAATASHTYATFGTFTVTLTVTDTDGLTATASHQITVVDETPTASFTISAGPHAVGQAVTFTGSGSDPDGTINSYAWNFGDGTTGTGATASHTYANPGTYTVTLTVADSNGRSAAVSHQIRVYSPPAASFGFSPPAPLTGTPVGFNGSGSSDPDPGVTISSYAWNFGDGSTGSGATPSHAYSKPGNYTVTLTVTNSVGLTATSSAEITIFAPPPTASFVVTTPHPAADVPVQFNGSSSSAPQGSITSYVWNFGDGSTARGIAPAHIYTGAGTYRVSLTIVSTSGLSATANDAVVVVTGGRIKKISVSTKRGSKLLAISLTGPGRLSVGTRRIAIARAETVRVRVTPTAAGRRRLIRTHRLRMIVPVTFTPQIGRPTKTRVSLSFRR